MNSNYAPPNAEPNDDRISKGRIAHIVLAITSGFISSTVLTVIFVVVAFGSDTTYDFSRVLLASILCSLMAGVVVWPFPNLRWYLALLAGAILSPVIGIVLAVVFSGALDF